MNKIKFHTIENELFYKGKIILKYEMEYPELVETRNKEKLEEFNHINLREIKELKEYIEEELYEKTKKEGRIEFLRECNVIQNEEGLITLSFNEYIEFTNEHNTEQKTKIETWNLN